MSDTIEFSCERLPHCDAWSFYARLPNGRVAADMRRPHERYIGDFEQWQQKVIERYNRDQFSPKKQEES